MDNKACNDSLIYVIEDEEKMIEILKINLSKRYNVKYFDDAENALKNFNKIRPELILTDVRLPGIDGIEFMEKVKNIDQNIPFIIFTGYGSIDHAVETIKKGAFDYLVKPIKIENLKQSIDRALSYIHISKSPIIKEERAKIVIKGMGLEFITVDPRTIQMLNLAQKASHFNSPILIVGETGTGKDLFARYIHENSKRKGPFVELNCASIPKDILEGELFGYKKGSFTGAVNDYEGKIALSDGGTLFLDEIGELPLEAQAKLLHVLEIPEYYPIGSNVKRSIDLNMITATNRNLRNMVDEGSFRPDLYYRIAVIPIKVPPLRERKCDVLPIVEYFLRQNKKNYILSPMAKLKLLEYNWPGNIRELKNIIERSKLLADNGDIINDIIFDSEGHEDVESIISKELYDIPDKWEEFKDFKSSIVKRNKDNLERRFIEKLLINNNGNISLSARNAGIDRRQLQDMIKELNIDASIFRGKSE